MSEFRRLKRIESESKSAQNLNVQSHSHSTNQNNAATLSGFGIVSSTLSNPSNNLINQVSQIQSERVVSKPEILKSGTAGTSYRGLDSMPLENNPLPKEVILQGIRKKYHSRASRLISGLEAHETKVTLDAATVWSVLGCQQHCYR